MTSKLKCPFCGKKLVRHWGMESPAIYCCDNQKCKRGGVGTEQSWQALIQAKQDLGIATKALKDARILASTHCIATAVKTIDKALEQIEHKDIEI